MYELAASAESVVDKVFCSEKVMQPDNIIRKGN